ncbi:hypothetical protein BO94DRAFT_201120 [Aspergillus sclerotioniger CBS 115572]|uniref:Uncharacterized protein n=1 Tax=Aspergillus sclerotioniger CBS 115572 TaxID=1450535 RepID=A0A317VSW2_9EURO|nr:hypothetical protein BO94DRAFT_201120 [Aspergillus sclerotioniger CBS 115572]PWY76401.1 hypothetical protein BO94DRAFT_201120 [Aspergillus sclerotioniger CBS 115572]
MTASIAADLTTLSTPSPYRYHYAPHANIPRRQTLPHNPSPRPSSQDKIQKETRVTHLSHAMPCHAMPTTNPSHPWIFNQLLPDCVTFLSCLAL